jgi:hypothetical protein
MPKLKPKKKSVAIIVTEKSRRDRAIEYTKCLVEFESSFCKWPDYGRIFLEVETEELYNEVGCETMTEWFEKHAPASERLCRAIKSRYKALAPYIPIERLRLIRPQTAEWAKRSTNISPASLGKPEVQDALQLPLQKAVEQIQKVAPNEHVESTPRIICKFAESQYVVIQKAYESYKLVKDEHGSFEDAIEFWAAEWVLQIGQSRDQESS